MFYTVQLALVFTDGAMLELDGLGGASARAGTEELIAISVSQRPLSCARLVTSVVTRLPLNTHSIFLVYFLLCILQDIQLN